MSKIWIGRIAHVEFFLIGALAFVLPILEGPKNLAAFLILVVWIVHRIVARDLQVRRPDLVEAGLLGIVLICLASTIVNWPMVNGLKGLKDTLMQVFIFWVMYRSRYGPRQRLVVAAWLVAGVLVGLAWGVTDVLRGKEHALQFHSAGIVTQSAIYLGVVMSLTFSVSWFSGAMPTTNHFVGKPALWWSALSVMLVCLFLMGSRGAILAVFLTGIGYALLIGQRRVWFVFVSVVSLAALASILLPDRFEQSRWLKKSTEFTSTGQLTSADKIRVENWRIALARVGQGDALWLGIGPRNFSSINPAELSLDPPTRLQGHLNHAHNLFLNKLVEEGILGLAAMLFFFGIILVKLAREVREGAWKNWPWGAAAGALAIPIVAGSVNTPWYLEHALLSMMLFALYLSSRFETNNSKP